MLSPDRVNEARQFLIARGDEPCRSNCDVDYILQALSPHFPTCSQISIETRTSEVENLTKREGRGRTGARVFFESSNSMNGYIAQQAGLRDHLADFGQRLASRLDPIVDEVEYIYIGSNQKIFEGESGDFIATLTPSTIPNVGRSVSDIATLVDSAVSQTSTNQAIILISDYILSPGKKESPDAYITSQRIAIREIFEQLQLRLRNASVALVDGESAFKGTYYGCQDQQKFYVGTRPYYMLIAGPHDLVVPISERAVASTGGRLLYLTSQTTQISAKALPINPNGQEGSYTISVDQDGDGVALLDAAPAKSGISEDELWIELAVNLMVIPDASHVIERATLDNGYSLEDIEPLPISSAPYTHKVRIKHVGRVFDRLVTLIIPKAPTNSLEDRATTDCSSDPTNFPGKTFGFNSISNGITEAFRRSNDTPLATLQFTVKP